MHLQYKYSYLRYYGLFSVKKIKQAKISANGARKNILFSLWIKIIFLTSLEGYYLQQNVDLNFFFRKEHYLKWFYLYSKCILIQECLDIYTWKQDKNTK